MVHAAEPTNTPAPTQPLVPAVVPAAGAEIAPLTAALAVNPNLERARAAPIPSRPTVLAALTGRLARARPLETAAALPTTAAIRPLIVALGGKSNTVYPIRDGTHC